MTASCSIFISSFCCLLLSPPRVSGPDIIDQEAYALVIRRIQPEHTLEDKRRFGKPFQPPKAQPVALQAPQKRTVVHVAPRERAVESGGASGSAPGSTCSISKAGRFPRAMIGLAHSSIGSSSSPQYFFSGFHMPMA